MPEPTLRGRVARDLLKAWSRSWRGPPRARCRRRRGASSTAAAAGRRGDARERVRVRGGGGPVKVECDEASAEEIESEDEEDARGRVEEEDAIVEVTRRPARRGYPEPSFEGLEALRAAPKDYHELAAALASAGASIEGGDRPAMRTSAATSSARVAAVTITVHCREARPRHRDDEIDDVLRRLLVRRGRRIAEARLRTQATSPRREAACVRRSATATKALNPIETNRSSRLRRSERPRRPPSPSACRRRPSTYKSTAGVTSRLHCAMLCTCFCDDQTVRDQAAVSTSTETQIGLSRLRRLSWPCKVGFWHAMTIHGCFRADYT